MTAHLRIGLDFDNTIIQYDQVFYKLALARGFIGIDIPQTKQAVRGFLRGQSRGEIQWQILQAEVYGPRLGEARPFPGIEAFLSDGIRQGAKFFIVSHKNRFAAQDREYRHDLIEASQTWLSSYGIVGEDRPVCAADVYFESSRLKKCERIASLGCDVFIDDLEEIFAEPGFPRATKAILIGQKQDTNMAFGILCCQSWQDVTSAVFGHVG